MKRYSVGILALILCWLLSIPIAAADELTFETEHGTYTYKTSGTTCTITAYEGTAAELSVPAVIDGFSVTAIGASAFKTCTTLTRVALPSGITTIGTKAFQSCSTLEELVISSDLTALGSSALANCTSLKSIVLPDSLITLESSVFSGCSALESVSLPAQLENIGRYAFKNCTSLKQVTFPQSVTTIKDYAFQNCTQLTSLCLNPGLVSISGYAFSGCTALERVVFPDSLTLLGGYAFENCAALSEISYPKNLTETSNDNSPFPGCTSLTEVTIPAGVTAIPDDMFRNCTALTAVTLPEGLQTIGSYAFSGCALTQITLPDTLTSIGTHAFQNCTALAKANIPAGVAALSNYAFDGCTALSQLALAEGPTSLGRRSFGGCTSLSTVSLPKTVKTIGTQAFSGCTDLKSVSLSEGLTTIDSSAFEGCTALESLVLPDSVTTIGNEAFRTCNALKNITFGNKLSKIDTYAFAGCTSLTAAYLPDSLTSLGCYAFQGCSSLASLGYPKNVTELTGMVTPVTPFGGCSALVSVDIPAGTTTIPDYMFRNCSALKTVTFPEGLTTIGTCAFAATGLTQVVLPEGLSRMESNAFQNCTALTKITFPSTLASTGGTVFSDCTALKEIVFAEGLETIGGSAFRDCTALEQVTLPASLKTVGASAFSGCSNLTRATAPEGLVSINASAFGSCENLEAVYVPGMATSAAKTAFSGCDALAIHCYAGSAIYQYAMDYDIPVVLMAEHEHTMEETARAAATCTKAGSYTMTCSDCGYNQTSVIDALGHDYQDSYTTDRQPGCESTGTESRHCSRCISKTDPRSIPALGHDYDEQYTLDKEATCEKAGSRSRHCSRCEETTDSQVLPALGHRYSVWMITTPATVTEDGIQTRVCQNCALQEEQSFPCIEIPEGEEDRYGIGHLQVVHAQTLTPVANASITVYTEEGEITMVTDSEGKTSHVFPVGRYPVLVTASGFKPRSMHLSVMPGEQEFPKIGLSTRDLVDVKFTAEVMTIDEIVEAGIDINDEANRHVYKYKIELTFKPEVDVMQLLAYFNFEGQYLGAKLDSGEGEGVGGGSADGGGSAGLQYWLNSYNPSTGTGGVRWEDSNGEIMTVYPVDERFLLIVHGEVQWVKEMFDVEMVVMNNSMTDTVEDCVAMLDLPEGLSLAPLMGQGQTLRQEIGTIEEGSFRSAHWFVRGDQPGSYDLSGYLQGTLMPFGDSFGNFYHLDSPLKVYAGSALKLIYEVPQEAYYGETYPMTITLENVSDRTLYDVRHTLTGASQKRITYYSDGSQDETTLSEQEGEITVRAWEFKPGDKLVIQLDTVIQFDSRLLKDEILKYVDFVDTAATFLEALDFLDTITSFTTSMAGYFETFVDEGLVQVLTDIGVDEIKGQLKDLLDYGVEALFTGELPEWDAWWETEKAPDAFDTVRSLVNAIPMKYVLEEVAVTKLDESTTDIPYEIRYVPSQHEIKELSESISVEKFVMSLVSAMIGEVDVEFMGFTLASDLFDSEGSTAYLSGVLDQVDGAGLVDPSDASGSIQARSDTTFRVYTQGADEGVSIDIRARTVDGTEILPNDEGVLIFDGPGHIEYRPVLEGDGSAADMYAATDEVPVLEAGSIYVQAGDQAAKEYVLTVFGAHECTAGDWTVELPPTEVTVGLQAKYCQICKKTMELECMRSCGSHSFSGYTTALAPTQEHKGVETRTCDHCGVLEYRIVEHAGPLVTETTQKMDNGSATQITFPLARTDVTADQLQLTLPDGTPVTAARLHISGTDLVITLDEPVYQQTQWVLKDLYTSCPLTALPFFCSEEELLLDSAREEYLTKDESTGQSYIILSAQDTWASAQALLSAPDVVERTGADGRSVSDQTELATGQVLSALGLSRTLTIVVSGDVDGDGAITGQDAQCAMALALDAATDSTLAVLAADMDRSGALSARDVAAIALHAAAVNNPECTILVCTCDVRGIPLSIRLADAQEDIELTSLTALPGAAQTKLFILTDTFAPLTPAVVPKE